MIPHSDKRQGDIFKKPKDRGTGGMIKGSRVRGRVVEGKRYSASRGGRPHLPPSLPSPPSHDPLGNKGETGSDGKEGC